MVHFLGVRMWVHEKSGNFMFAVFYVHVKLQMRVVMPITTMERTRMVFVMMVFVER